MIRIVLAAIALLFVTGAAARELRLGAEDSWPPFSGADGQGLSNSIVNHAFQAVGIKTHLSVFPYARVLFFVETGDLDGGFNVTRQHSTETTFVFGETPILHASTSFYYAKDHERAYQSIADVPDGARIGLIIDYEYGDAFEAHRARLDEVRVATQEQLILMLLAGRVDVIILFDKVADYTLAKMHNTRFDFDPASVVRGARHHTSDIYVVFSRKTEDAAALAAALDRGLAILHQNGDYERIWRGELK